MENNTEIKAQIGNKKKIVIIATVVLVLLVAAYFIYQYIQNKKEQELEQQLKAKYQSDMKKLVFDMIGQSARAERIIKTYSNVWDKAIEESIKLEAMSQLLNIQRNTLKKFLSQNEISYNMVTTEVVYKGDFSKALIITKLYFHANGKIDTLETSKAEISQRISELNNPPNEYQKAYEVSFQMYSAYDEYVSLAIEPSGSVDSFKEQTSELSSDIIKEWKEFEARMPLN
jgi:hypothetical protein